MRFLWKQKEGISNLGLDMSGKGPWGKDAESPAQLKNSKVLTTYLH